MGHFFNPPPPIVSATGAQPHAPNKLPPQIMAVEVDNPPFSEELLVDYNTILAVWNPPIVHNYIHKAGQPYDYAKLPPQITAVEVDNPPFTNRSNTPTYLSVAAIWNPDIVHNYIHRAGQPYDYLKLPAQITAVEVDNPPFSEEQLVTLNAILGVWNPPVVHNYIHRAGQPYDYAKLSPGIPGQSVDQPVFNTRQLVNLNIVSIWNPDIVHNYIHRAGQPYDYAKLNPQITAVPVNNPPFTSRTELFNILQQWQPSVYPLPQTLILQPQPTVIVSTQGPYANLWLATVLSAWTTDYQLPQLGTKLPPQIIAVEVDNPPFNSRNEIPNSILAIHNPPTVHNYIHRAGQPYDYLKLPAQITAVEVDNPPFTSRTEIPGILRQWQPPDPLPTLPPMFMGRPGWSVDNPPSALQVNVIWIDQGPLPQTSLKLPQGTAVVVQTPFVNQWMTTVLSAWQPPSLQPILNVKLPPQITAVAVNNPPFNSRTEIPNILAQWQPPPPLPTPSIRINIVQGGTAPIITVREWLIRARRRRR